MLLTEMQADILAVLLEPPGHWKTHKEIAGKVYGDTGYNEKAGVRKHVARIWTRLDALSLGVRIETAHAPGYSFVVEGVNDAMNGQTER